MGLFPIQVAYGAIPDIAFGMWKAHAPSGRHNESSLMAQLSWSSHLGDANKVNWFYALIYLLHWCIFGLRQTPIYESLRPSVHTHTDIIIKHMLHSLTPSGDSVTLCRNTHRKKPARPEPHMYLASSQCNTHVANAKPVWFWKYIMWIPRQLADSQITKWFLWH